MELGICIRDGDDGGVEAHLVLREDLVKKLVRRPASVRRLSGGLSRQARRMVGGLAEPERVFEFGHQALRFFLNVLLAGLHGQHEADLLLRHARGCYALDSEAEDLRVFLVVGEAHEVVDVLPTRTSATLPHGILHLCIVNCLKVCVLEMCHLFRAQETEEADVGAHLPALVDAEDGQKCKGVECSARKPKGRRNGDEGRADEDGEFSPKVPDGSVHIDDLEGSSIGGRGFPDSVFVHDGEDIVVDSQSIRPRRE
mmetsp:Transcript_25077/g.54570  ORF Transcript_25077/g.54570 Transcript_25077/m.54570 type:complete len:255 (+) Transcript_25077:1080-1844(+)